MAGYLHELGKFLWASINNWAGYSTGGVIVAVVSLWHVLKNRQISRKLGLCLAALFLFLAFFKAWQEQFERGENLQIALTQKPQQPPIQINVPQARQPTIQVNVPKPPPAAVTVIQPLQPTPTADSGNLRDRLSALSQEILAFVEMRKGILESLYHPEKPGTDIGDVNRRWNAGTSGQFRGTYEHRVFAIRNECANLHIIDTELDNELGTLQLAEKRGFAVPYYPPLDSIKKIGERLAVLATQVNK